MKLLIVAAALLVAVYAHPALNKDELARKEQMVDLINKQGLWKAKLNPRFSSREEFKALLGAKRRHEHPNPAKFTLQAKSEIDIKDIPKEFDARKKWPKCADVIGSIADQSACGSCWAVSATSVMSDRVCIGSDGANKTPVSANDVVSCCSDCGFGCQGGWPDEAFYYWSSVGVVSGSSYAKDQGCKPYPFAECEHHNNKTHYPQCPKKIYDTPKCQKQCQGAYKEHPYNEDKSYGKSTVYLSGDVAAIQKEIMTNGPVVFTFTVYEDFEFYSSGIYKHTTGSYLGGHAVRAVGWGEENNTPYWLIANSWNEDWGEDGYFRMIRGEDDCGIEEEVSAAQFKTK